MIVKNEGNVVRNEQARKKKRPRKPTTEVLDTS
jgi:hypothetical protein